jgi:hypothetical protein
MAMCLWLLFIATSTSLFAHVARAQEANPCTPDSRKVTYYDKDRMGFEITFPEDIAPPFPIVFGQDLQEKTGVTIKIEIRSTQGLSDLGSGIRALSAELFRRTVLL